jgi:RNA polymerase sigma factor (sigma-70 family)
MKIKQPRKNTFMPTPVSLLGRLQDRVSIDVWNASWFEFTKLYGGVIHSYAYRRGLQPADADEVRSLVLVKIQRGLTTFKYNPHRGRFLGWVMTITHNEFCTYLRKLMRWRDLIADVHSADDVGDPIDGYEAPDIQPEIYSPDRELLNNILEEALTRVRQKCRKDWVFRAFELHFLKGVPIPEIVKILGITSDSASVYTHRMLKAVKEAGSEMWRDCEQGRAVPGCPPATAMCA